MIASSFGQLFIISRIIAGGEKEWESIVCEIPQQLQQSAKVILLGLSQWGFKFYAKHALHDCQSPIIYLIYQIAVKKYPEAFESMTSLTKKSDNSNYYQYLTWNQCDLVSCMFQFLQLDDINNCTLVNSNWLFNSYNINSLYYLDLTRLLHVTKLRVWKRFINVRSVYFCDVFGFNFAFLAGFSLLNNVETVKIACVKNGNNTSKQCLRNNNGHNYCPGDPDACHTRQMHKFLGLVSNNSSKIKNFTFCNCNFSDISNSRWSNCNNTINNISGISNISNISNISSSGNISSRSVHRNSIGTISETEDIDSSENSISKNQSQQVKGYGNHMVGGINGIGGINTCSGIRNYSNSNNNSSKCSDFLINNNFVNMNGMNHLNMNHISCAVMLANNLPNVVLLNAKSINIRDVSLPIVFSNQCEELKLSHLHQIDYLWCYNLIHNCDFGGIKHLEINDVTFHMSLLCSTMNYKCMNEICSKLVNLEKFTMINPTYDMFLFWKALSASIDRRVETAIKTKDGEEDCKDIMPIGNMDGIPDINNNIHGVTGADYVIRSAGIKSSLTCDCSHINKKMSSKNNQNPKIRLEGISKCLSDKQNSENMVDFIRDNRLKASEIECDIASDSIECLQSLLKAESIEKSLEKIECTIIDKNAFKKLLEMFEPLRPNDHDSENTSERERAVSISSGVSSSFSNSSGSGSGSGNGSESESESGSERDEKGRETSDSDTEGECGDIDVYSGGISGSNSSNSSNCSMKSEDLNLFGSLMHFHISVCWYDISLGSINRFLQLKLFEKNKCFIDVLFDTKFTINFGDFFEFESNLRELFNNVIEFIMLRIPINIVIYFRCPNINSLTNSNSFCSLFSASAQAYHNRNNRNYNSSYSCASQIKSRMKEKMKNIPQRQPRQEILRKQREEKLKQQQKKMFEKTRIARETRPRLKSLRDLDEEYSVIENTFKDYYEQLFLPIFGGNDGESNWSKMKPICDNRWCSKILNPKVSFKFESYGKFNTYRRCVFEAITAKSIL